MAITTEKIGRRIYLNGNTYAHRDLFKSKGCTWDPEKKSWWTGSAEKAAEIVDEITTKHDEKRSGGLDDRANCLTGKATYEGRTYYTTNAVTRDGKRQMLSFLDGSATFWVSPAKITAITVYQSPKSLSSLRSYRITAGSMEEGYYRNKKGNVLASGCWECSRKGTMCASCRHDYE